METLASRCAEVVQRINQLAAYKHCRRQYAELLAEVEQVRATYGMMLRFLVGGQQDVEARHIHESLVERMAVAGERAAWMAARGDVPLPAVDLKEDIAMQFDALCHSDVWTKGQLACAKERMHAEETLSDDICLLVSALTLALHELFDAGKFLLLCDAYDLEEPRISSRAVVGIALALFRHGPRLREQRACRERLDWLFGLPTFCERLFVIIRQLEHSKLTERISDKLNRDIMPAILNGAKFKRLRLGQQDAQQALTEHGENLEWFLPTDADEEAQRKMRQMTEMQMEGADIYMNTFSQLRHRLPQFFSETANWFRPFNPEDPFVMQVMHQCDPAEQRTLRMLVAAAPFCDSDKYAFVAMFDIIGPAGRQTLLQTLGNEIGDEPIDEVLGEQAAEQRTSESLSRYAIWDLYRFCALRMKKDENIFHKSKPHFTPLRSVAFEPLLGQIDALRELAEFFMRQGVYEEALALFLHIYEKGETPNASLWQEIGFCEQHLGRINDAYEHYTRAFSMQPRSVWTLRHLIETAIQLRKFIEADTYCDLLLEEVPEDPKVVKTKVFTLLRMRNYADALPLFFKVSYLGDEEPATVAALVQCLLRTGQPDKALEQAQALLARMPENEDAIFCLAGVYLCRHDLQTVYDLLHPLCLAYLDTPEKFKNFRRRFAAMCELPAPEERDEVTYGMLLDAIVQGTE